MVILFENCVWKIEKYRNPRGDYREKVKFNWTEINW
jgi:hypothetical protein